MVPSFFDRLATDPFPATVPRPMQRRVRWLQPLKEILTARSFVIKKHFRVECSLMALRTYLDDRSFDPETVRLMGVAFEIALATLRPSDDADPLREAVARK